MNGPDGVTLENETDHGVDTNNDDDNRPRLYDHCVALYALMESNAKETSDGKIYIGSLTNLFDTLGLSQSSHSRIVGRMKAMGCIAMLKRGGGKSRSVWGLYEAPTFEAFYRTDTTGDAVWAHKAENHEGTMQRIKDLSNRLIKIEDALRDRGIIL